MGRVSKLFGLKVKIYFVLMFQLACEKGLEIIETIPLASFDDLSHQEDHKPNLKSEGIYFIENISIRCGRVVQAKNRNSQIQSTVTSKLLAN